MSKVIKFFSKNKKALFFIIGLGLILFSLPSSFVRAEPVIQGPLGSPFTPPGGYDLCEHCGPWPNQWPHCFLCIVSYLASLPVRIMFAALVVIFGVGSLIAGIFYALVAALISWLIGVIMSVGIVPGAPNTPGIVSAGWDFSRQFANLFFILALAFIGLATILRIREYEAKKALPTLIIIALLINFTPVIVGFVVDMGNIVTKFFLDAAGNIRNLIDIIGLAKDYLLYAMADVFLRDGEWWAKFFEIVGQSIGIVVYGLVLFIFFNLAMFVYLLIGAVFFCRTVILWILMIISPIAFLSKVFPATRTTKMIFPDILHWDKWWQSLIQWTIIGIPIGFFLYLSNEIMKSDTSIGLIFNSAEMESQLATTTASASSTLLVPLGDQFVSMFVSLLAPVVGLVVLAMGVLISFKAVPEGAKGIMSFTHERGVQGAWRRIKGIPRGIRGAVDSVRTARELNTTLTTRRAVWQVIKRGTWEKRPWKEDWKQGWPWQQGQQPPASSTAGDGTTTASATTGAGTSAAGGGAVTAGGGGGGGAPISHAQEIGEIAEEATTEQISPTITPTAPSVSKHRARAAKAGRGALRFFITEPGKVGLWAGKGIVKAVESTVTKRIDKELGIKGAKDTDKTKRTRNCPYCQEKIPANSRFCQHCGEELE